MMNFLMSWHVFDVTRNFFVVMTYIGRHDKLYYVMTYFGRHDNFLNVLNNLFYLEILFF